MKVEEFDFDLPAERIAQHPAPERDASRLLALGRASGARTHHAFDALAALLAPGDLLVLNDTRVLHARLGGRKASGGRVEALLLEPLAPGAAEWTCLIRASRLPHADSMVRFDGGLAAQVVGREGELWTLRFDRGESALIEALARSGELPLPPYIRRAGDAQDAERYQTVFARRSTGSARGSTRSTLRRRALRA